jgi:hypothetical protein
MRVLILSLIVLGAALAPTLAASPTIEGSWRGSGTITHRRSVDAVQCRATFRRDGAKSFAVSSQCTTDTGRYDVSGHVRSSGGARYSGSVQANGQGGAVAIVQHGNHLSVTVTSRRGSGRLSLTRN